MKDCKYPIKRVVLDRNGDEKFVEGQNLDFEKFRKVYNYKKWKTNI
jgi:hypothetical protein